MGTIWAPEVQFSDLPKYQSVLDALRHDIGAGLLEDGVKLPPVRNLAYDLGVTPGTIARAYKEGIAEGFLEAATGRGTFVRANRPAPPVPKIMETEEIDLRHSDAVHVGQDKIISDTFQQIGRDGTFLHHLYPVRRGSDDLNALLADWMEPQGLRPRPEKIIHTYGGQSALMLSAMALYQQTHLPIAIDQLIYPGLRTGLQSMNIPIRSIEIDDQGMVPAALEAVLKEERIAAVMTSANVLNPTLGMMGLDRRRALVALAEKYDFQIVEDDCWGIGPADCPAFHSLAPTRGWYFSSLSKTVASGLRFGYLVVPDAYQGIVATMGSRLSYGVSTVLTDVVRAMLANGAADKIKADIADLIAARVALSVNRLGAFDLAWRRDVPFLWLKLPRGWRASSFVAACEARKIRLRAADEFAVADTRLPSAVRISVNCNLSEARYLEALDIMAELLANPPEAVGS